MNVAAVITEDDFQSYVDVQRSGEVNMFDVNTVCDLTYLTRDEVGFIMEHYEELTERYPGIADNIKLTLKY